MSFKKREMLTFPERLSSPLVFCGFRLAHPFRFLSCVLVLIVFVLCLVPNIVSVSSVLP